MSADGDAALRQLLAKRSEELRDAQASLVRLLQGLGPLVHRVETLADRKSREGDSSDQLLARLSAALGVLEDEAQSRTASEKRKAEIFLAELAKSASLTTTPPPSSRSPASSTRRASRARRCGISRSSTRA